MSQIVQQSNHPLFLGIDGGGSKCKVVLSDANGQLLGEGLSGPANPVRGLDVAVASILEATEQALQKAGLPSDDKARLYVGAGLAGVNIPEYFQRVSTWRHPFKALFVTTDLHVACLGAHQGQDGAVMIAGTGSCGLASVAGRLLEIGGYGFPHSDQASGAWLGLRLVQEVLQAKDGLAPQTMLGELLGESLGQSSALAIASHFLHASPTEFAKFAPLVFHAAKAGDAFAQRLLEEAAAALNQMAERLLAFEPPSLALLGGVAEQLKPYLAASVQQKITPVQQAPELGAVFFAKQKMHKVHQQQ